MPERSEKRRRLRFTREGKYYVALTVGIGFAAINTGNNLLYLVLGMLLTLIIGSGVLSDISLRALVVTRKASARLFANKPFLMGIGLRNGKRTLPSFSIEIEDLLEGQPLDKKCYFLKVPAGRTQHTSYRHVFPRRGLYKLSGFRVSTRFPFGLFKKTREWASDLSLLVYPEIIPIGSLPSTADRSGEERGGTIGRWGEYHGLRDYREGDDPRDIFWRKSAQVGRPLIREQEDPTGRQATIFLDNRAARELSPELLEEQERAVSRAASLATHYAARDYQVSLVSWTVEVKTGAGQAHLDRILRALALVQFVEAPRQGVTPRLPESCIRVQVAPVRGAAAEPA